MSWDEKTGNAFCERCGHGWNVKAWDDKARKRIVYFEPKSCAKCKNKGWNKPRVYVSQLSEKVIYPMATRYKATGRQSARIKREEESQKLESIRIAEQQEKNAQFDKEIFAPWNIEKAAKKYRYTISDFKLLPNYEQRRMLIDVYYDDVLGKN